MIAANAKRMWCEPCDRIFYADTKEQEKACPHCAQALVVERPLR